MPRKQTHCARNAGHAPPCASPEAMERQRGREADRRPKRVIEPEAKARWNRAYKPSLKGLTERKFRELLRAQGYACAMCRQPLGDDPKKIFADHDHACCPGTRSCGGCLRGLLCLTCNIAVGYVEAYGEMVRGYLQSSPQMPSMKSPGSVITGRSL